jgi:hypothetical protein
LPCAARGDSSRTRAGCSPASAPHVTIEVETETIDVIAHEASGEERERLVRTQAKRFPLLSEYEQKTYRIIPVIMLTPREGA